MVVDVTRNSIVYEPLPKIERLSLTIMASRLGGFLPTHQSYLIRDIMSARDLSSWCAHMALAFGRSWYGLRIVQLYAMHILVV